MYDSIIIVGPTASGKTKISIELAKKLGSEIINADSLYIYKDLSIGTAKPTPEEMKEVKHHLINFVDSKSNYNVVDYRNDVINIIKDFRSRNLIPIIVGGTGFYIDSLISNYSYGDNTHDDDLRKSLISDLDKHGKEYLYNKLKDIDSVTASKLHVNDTARIIRAIEIKLLSGTSKSQMINKETPILSNPLIIALNMPREELYARINLRVDKMLDMGLIDEIKALYNAGLHPNTHQSMRAIGYKEIVDYFEHKIDFDTAIDKIKQHTRNYAKRQITWFKRYNNIIWLNPLEEYDIVSKITDLYNS